MDRRSVLAGAATAAGLSAGCVALSPRVPGGALVITNESPTDHTLSFEVMKISEDYDDVPYGDKPRPDGQPLDRWNRTFEVAAGESVRENEFITEPGAYFIEISTAAGRTAGGWIGLYPAGPQGEQLAESHVAVLIEEDSLSLSAPTLD